jgi:hypothetical protein
MARSRLIPTEATPVSSRNATPEPTPAASTRKSAKASTSKLGTAASSSIATAAANVAPTSSNKPKKVHSAQVANGFVALPVALSPFVPGLANITQHIYLRRKVVVVDNAVDNTTDDIVTPSSSSEHVVFAVNLPYGSTEDSIKQGFEALLKARSPASSSSSLASKGKGKAKEDVNSTSLSVEKVEFVKSTHQRIPTVLETEGITHPNDLLKQQEVEQLSKLENLSKKQKKALQQMKADQQAVVESTSNGESSSSLSKNRIHPLFISSDITLAEAVDLLFPTSSTLKAHITLSSSKAVQVLLNDKPTSSWTITSWPSAPVSGLTLDGKPAKARDEILFDLARPSADSVKIHVDDWMKVFDEEHPTRIALALRAAQAAEDALPKSKRAQARETAAKATAKAKLDRKKALKRRRVYDDDFDEPEADADGWITVTAAGVKGRGGQAEGGEDDDAGMLEDEEDIRQAELEGFVSGRRTVGIARKDFIKEKAKEIAEDRKKQLLLLNNKLGVGEDDKIDSEAATAAKMLLDDEEEDASRGGGRGRKKKMKKSRGIEMGMYGFERREQSKKSKSRMSP